MKKIIPLLSLIARIITVFIVVILFFLGYNRFLLDKSIGDLKTALTDITDARPEDAKEMVSYALSKELLKPIPEITTVMALEYSKSILSGPGSDRPLVDAEAMLKSIIDKKEMGKTAAHKAMDNVTTTAMRTFGVKGGSAKALKDRVKIEIPDKVYRELEQIYPFLTKYRSALKFREQKDYDEFNKTCKELAEQYKTSEIAPLILFQVGSTYMYDLQDVEKATEVFDTLKKQYPASFFAHKGLDSTGPKWLESTPMRMAQKAVSLSAAQFVQIMIYFTNTKLLLEEKKAGDTFEIKPSDARVTNETKRFINKYLSKTPFSIQEIEIKYLPGNRVRVQGTGKAGMFRFKGFFLGKMMLTKRTLSGVSPITIPWLSYKIERATLGNVNLPPEVANKLLAESHKVFNASLPFELKTFVLDDKTGLSIFEGIVRSKERILIIQSALRGSKMLKEEEK